MNYTYDRFSDLKDFHLQHPAMIRAKATFPGTVEEVRKTWQTKPFVADQNGRILTNQTEFAALEDLKHVHIGVVQWHGFEPIDLAAARNIVSRILALCRKQSELQAAVDLLRLAEVDRKSVELELARLHVSMNNNMR